MKSNAEIFRIDNLSVTYPGGHEALSNINLSVSRGQTMVLLGSSGAGKSTLLRCMNGLQVPTLGTIDANGSNITQSAKALRLHRRKTAMVFQLHHLLARRTALENVLMGRLAYHGTLRSILPLPKADVALCMECLERVGLVHKALNRADCLSGGERQRVGIARALAQQPEVILADEPVASLDPASCEAIMSLLCSVTREDNMTLIFSLHQINLARRYGERIVGLKNGNMVFDAAPEMLTAADLKMIYDRHLHPDTAATPTPAQGPNERSENTKEKSTALSSDYDESSLIQERVCL